MLKAIIFDFDYTLGNSTSGIVISANYALGKLGYEPRNTVDIKNTIGLTLKETFYALTSSVDLNEAAQFVEFFKQKADSVMVDNTELYAGVKEVLKKLKTKGYKTAIVTTKYHYRIDQILRKFDANELIDIIVGSDDVKIEKPNPEGLLWAIEHLDVKLEDVLYVGDSIVDAMTAENAKVDFAAVLTGTTTREDFDNYNSVYIGDNVSKVYEFISA